MSAVVVMSLCALAATQGSVASATLDPQLIRVHVRTDDSGIADELEARRESVRHLADAIAGQKKGKAFVLVQWAAVRLPGRWCRAGD